MRFKVDEARRKLILSHPEMEIDLDSPEPRNRHRPFSEAC
jgi:hypothetical protein